MKKNSIYALMSAIALTGAVGFCGCSSSDDVINNPNYNPDDNTVKTEFTISFPDNVAHTRMSGATVQDAGDIASFRGMDNIVLYPFVELGATGENPVAVDSKNIGGKISLTTIIKPSNQTVVNTIPANSLTAKSNSVLYNDVNIPIGTGSFLFYGKAIDSGEDKFVNGSLTMTDLPATNPKAGDIKFSPVQIYPTGTTVSTVGTALAAYMSTIAKAEHWAECASNDDAYKEEEWYNSALGEQYTNFIAIKAGSSKMIQAAVQDLYDAIKDNPHVVATNIKTAITNSTYATVNATSGKLDFTATIGNSETTYFPGDKGLPDGAAILTYDATSKTFTQSTTGGTMGGMTASYDKYVYPASLYYYCNSGIKTSTESKLGLYDGNNTWDQITANTGFTSNLVSGSTRSVAILDPIQYAVGRMDATVKIANATLYDKKGNEYNASAGFTVTGVLIGGQKEVNYDFTTTTETTAPSYTIYDNISKSYESLSPSVATTTASGVNYTLALETTKDEPIYVAIELVNNGAYFNASDGVVPTGCKFYMVAQLDPKAATGVTGYDATTMNQVFRQDYKTIVNFTIKQGVSKDAPTGFDPTNGNTDGLGAAYITIPDLRAPKLELGLSVDLTWEAGLQFAVEL